MSSKPYSAPQNAPPSAGMMASVIGSGAPVTNDYPGDQPWAFSGGTIKQVVVDVSGEAYVDLEKEAIGMMKRD